MEHLLKSAAITSVEKELLEYFGHEVTSTPWQTVRITTTSRRPFTSTSSQSLGEKTRKGGCTLSVKGILRKREKYRVKLERPHLKMSALARQRAKAKTRARTRARAKKKAKAREGFATIAVSKDSLHESAPAPKWTGKGKFGSLRNSGRSTILASSRSSETSGGQEILTARANAQTNLTEKEVCPS